MKIFLPLFFCIFFSINIQAQEIHLVSDLTPGMASTFDEPDEGIIASLDSNIIFQLLNTDNKWELWRSNGEATGTSSFVEFDTDLSILSTLYYEDELLVFVGNTNTDYSELWRTDGTSSGTTMIHSENFIMEHLTILNDNIYYITDVSSSEEILNRISLTDNVVEQIISFDGFRGVIGMTTINNQLAILGAGTAGDRALLLSDGTAAGTQEIFSINDGSEFTQSLNLTTLGDRIFFFYTFPGNTPYILYTSDGTTEGTDSIGEYDFVPDLSFQRRSFIFEDKFLFRAEPIGASTNSQSLYISDGTAEGTINLDPAEDEYLRPSYFNLYNDEVYFSGDFAGFIFGLFKTDGTPEGTVLVTNGSEFGSGIDFGGWELTTHKGYLFYSGLRIETGFELYVSSDGSVENTTLYDINEGEASSGAGNMTSTSNFLFFEATHPETGRELYVFDIAECTNTTGELTLDICDGESIEVNGEVYTDAGSYEQMLENVNGCDSLLSIELSVNPLPSVDLGNDLTITNDTTIQLILDESQYASILWSDGSTSGTFTFDGNANGVGVFEVTVEVSNAFGCTQTDVIQITVDESTNIRDLERGILIKFWPNPITSDPAVLSFETTGLEQFQDGVFRLYDIQGRTIQQQVIDPSQNRFSLNLKNLEKGIYIIEFELDGGYRLSEKIIVK